MTKALTLFTLLICGYSTMANNIQVSNISVSGSNITFNIQWDNSWNTTNNINPLYPNNWDGAWVFIKYQNNIDNLWKHAKISNNNGDHTIAGGVLQINTSADSMGVFIRRSAAGNGNIASTTVTLKMGPQIGTGSFNFKVFGTEVVYIPQSNYQVGDGRTGGTSYFTLQDITAAKQSTGVGAGSFFTGSPAVPTTFPMGYNAFYLMKYEISNEQWVDYLNTLTYDQQASRIDVAPNAAANTLAYANNAGTISDNYIKIQSPGLNNTTPATFGCDLNNDNTYNDVPDGQNVAVGILGKADFYSWLDWSGMRPMTEMEFEKACRGTLAPVSGEYAWGSTNVAPRIRISLTDLGQPTERYAATVVNGQVMANANISATYGPARNGVFANASSGRESAGAGFYGNMELSGNLWEMCVMVDAAGVQFNGNHGDGTLTTLGEADVATWPSGAATGVGTGTTLRGGSWLETTSYTAYISTSYRSTAVAAGRSINVGCRAARTAP